MSESFAKGGLFLPFSRDEQSQFQIGSGLGLSICKKVKVSCVGLFVF